MVPRLNSKTVAALHREVDAIHLANSLYWKQGTLATVAAREKYQQRQDQLEEIRRAQEQYRDKECGDKKPNQRVSSDQTPKSLNKL
jgi:uncharacterized membrane protein